MASRFSTDFISSITARCLAWLQGGGGKGGMERHQGAYLLQKQLMDAVAADKRLARLGEDWLPVAAPAPAPGLPILPLLSPLLRPGCCTAVPWVGLYCLRCWSGFSTPRRLTGDGAALTTLPVG
jgi:hypothetical protein